MRHVAFAIVVASLAGLVLVAESSHASLYAPEPSFTFDFDDDGKPMQLPFAEFRRRLAVLMNALVQPKLDAKNNPDRQGFIDRIEKRKGKAIRQLLARDLAAHAVDLMRVGEVDKALEYIKPRATDRRPDYFVFATLAQLHAARGEWQDALRYHVEGGFDTEMPAELPGVSKAQRDWWAMLDEKYVPQYYRIHVADAAARVSLSAKQREELDADQPPLPLFPIPDDDKPQLLGNILAAIAPARQPLAVVLAAVFDALLSKPVNFINDAGVYEPGALAAAEKAKLPPDAVAIVQQLILWFPTDVRLYWLLAELYAAEGDLDSAIVIFDECVGGLAHGNRKMLMDHRYAIRAAIDARPKPEGPPISMRTILLYFGAVGLVALFALGRVIYRRVRAARA